MLSGGGQRAKVVEASLGFGGPPVKIIVVSKVSAYVTFLSLKYGFNALATTRLLTAEEASLTHLRCLCVTSTVSWGERPV